MRAFQLKLTHADKAVILDNITCIYCGSLLSKLNRTKEHVIGRRFVPKGSLNRSWNLIAGACRKCNNVKSTLEDDISAISMHPDLWGKHITSDKTVVNDALRKARGSVSSRTGKPVVESIEKISFKANYGPGFRISGEFSAPPQVDPQRIADLARLHVMACFYLITYKEENRTGGFWRGGFFVLPEARRADWGNSLHAAFMEKVANWSPRFILFNPDGYFQIAIRKCPGEGVDAWSWAVEWNRNFRVIGFFGDRHKSIDLVNSLPSVTMDTIYGQEEECIGMRLDVPLPPEQDLMFVLGS